ncbi:CopG family transcriptional regulator [Actinomadura adrarensis]|uniref:CopG family transcriptional regulator n=1 Tax=Actinomadura adrarensis TaxID=1819600 RepID=A0ABW3CQJ5_9ACTN
MGEPTNKYSVTMPRDIAEAARERSGPSGLSAYVTAAVARQLERDKLAELIAAGEAENGPVDPAAVEAKRAIFAQARAGQRGPVA